MKKDAKAKTKHNMSTFMKVAVIVAFVGVAAMVSGIVFKANAELSSRSIADANGVPKNWADEGNANGVAASSSLSAAMPNGGKYVQYTATVTNESSEDDLYVTHLAAYLSSDGTDEDGFMRLSSDSLEYTYTPNDEDSWEQIGLTQPSKSKDAFKLANELSVGRAETAKNSVYFRFYVVPNDSETDTINNTLSFKLRDDSGKDGYVTSGTMVAYQQKEQPTIAVVSDDDAEDGAGSSYVKPLGEYSYRPEIATVSGTIADAGIDEEFLPVSVIIMIVAVIIFAVCLAIYLPLRKY